MLTNRPVIVPDEAVIQITISSDNTTYLTVDGQVGEQLHKGDRVIVPAVRTDGAIDPRRRGGVLRCAAREAAVGRLSAQCVGGGASTASTTSRFSPRLRTECITPEGAKAPPPAETSWVSSPTWISASPSSTT